MRKLILPLFLFFFSYAASAQKLVLTPQIGAHSFRHEINTFSTYQKSKRYYSFSPNIGARLQYISKRGHGPFLGIRVGDITLGYHDSSRRSSTGILSFQFEGGYQWMSKPIYFKRIWDNGISREAFEKLERKGLAVQLQPFIGLVVNRVNSPEYISTTFGTTYDYSGYLSTPGITSGIGLAFSNNGRQLFTLSVHYTKGIGQLYGTSFHSSANNQVIQSTNGTNWNITLGVPINIIKKKR